MNAKMLSTKKQFAALRRIIQVIEIRRVRPTSNGSFAAFGSEVYSSTRTFHEMNDDVIVGEFDREVSPGTLFLCDANGSFALI